MSIFNEDLVEQPPVDTTISEVDIDELVLTAQASNCMTDPNYDERLNTGRNPYFSRLEEFFDALLDDLRRSNDTLLYLERSNPSCGCSRMKEVRFQGIAEVHVAFRSYCRGFADAEQHDSCRVEISGDLTHAQTDALKEKYPVLDYFFEE